MKRIANPVRPGHRTPLPLRALAAAFLIGLPSAAAAACGLAACPVATKPGSYAVGLQWRMTEFQAAGRDVSVQQGHLRLEWLPLRLPLHLGLDVAMTAPSERVTSAGWANPMAFVEASLPSAGFLGAAQFSLGLQAELPFGDTEGGYASDHAMAVPYATLRYPLGSFALTARAGWSVAVSLHQEDEATEGEEEVAALPLARSARTGRVAHAAKTSHTAHSAHAGHGDHAENAGGPAFVEPHSDNDVLFMAGVEWTRGFVSVGAALHEAIAVESSYSPRHALEGALFCRFDIGGRFQAVPEIRFPLSDEARIDGGGGIALRALF